MSTQTGKTFKVAVVIYPRFIYSLKSKRRRYKMPGLKVPIPADEIIEAVKKMKKHDREAFIEDLLAMTSPEYLQSIQEARAEYKAGKTKSHKEIFGE
jgi:hypothetical protein